MQLKQKATQSAIMFTSSNTVRDFVSIEEQLLTPLDTWRKGEVTQPGGSSEDSKRYKVHEIKRHYVGSRNNAKLEQVRCEATQQTHKLAACDLRKLSEDKEE